MEQDELIRTINQCRAGDAQAQERLILAVQQRVYYQCLKMLKHEANAEDAAQEILIAMLTKLDKLQESAAFWGWLNTMTMNFCRNQLTRGYKESQIPEDEEGNSLLDQYETLDEQEIPDQALDTAETRRMIAELVDDLPDAQRMAVLMYYYDEMSVKDIAQAMETTEGTIKSRLNYARKAIKDGVDRYTKQGIKLYSVSVLPYLLYFLRKDAQAHSLSQAQAAQLAAKALDGAAKAKDAAGAASASSTGSGTTGTAAAGTAAKAGAGLAAKIAAGALAAAIVVGGGTAIHHNMTAPSQNAASSAQSAGEQNEAPTGETERTRYQAFYDVVEDWPDSRFLLYDADQDGMDELMEFQAGEDPCVFDVMEGRAYPQFLGSVSDGSTLGTLTCQGSLYYAYRRDFINDWTTGTAVPKPNPYRTFTVFLSNNQPDQAVFSGYELSDSPWFSEGAEQGPVPHLDETIIPQADFDAAVASFQPLPTADSEGVMDQQTCLDYLKQQM